ncbi:MAG TPA: hypothetical protein VLE21_02075 [Candidatus Nitrosocosmicus sp.]|nr:hypothetical protein [Candidatus Nitrosocosmicus sp.]
MIHQPSGITTIVIGQSLITTKINENSEMKQEMQPPYWSTLME